MAYLRLRKSCWIFDHMRTRRACTNYLDEALWKAVDWIRGVRIPPVT